MQEAPKQIQFPDIAEEILAMANSDQDMRERNLHDESWDESLDKKNAERMKEIIEQIGWPTVSKVGEESSNDAWLLVQHADHDIEFQSRCLKLMRDLPPGEINPKNIALLTDRVNVNRGLPQIYGTQFHEVGGKHVPMDIEDLERVDERRREMGLDTLEENINRMHDKYPSK